MSRWSASSCSSSSRPGGRRRVAALSPAPSIGGRSARRRHRRGGREPRSRTASSTARTDQPSAAAWRASAPGAPGRASRAAPGRGRRTACRRRAGAGRRRQPEQAQRVGDRRAALADPLGDLVVGQPEVLDQLLEGGRLLERREVLAVEVLDQRLLDGADVVVGRAHDRRDRRPAGPLGRPPPPLAGDQLVTVVDGAHEDRAGARRAGRSTPPARRATPRRSGPAAGAGWGRCRRPGARRAPGRRPPRRPAVSAGISELSPYPTRCAESSCTSLATSR